MRIAVISDIHSNAEAFEAVLSDIDNSKIDFTISLGDNIGYGPEPEKTIELIRTRGIPSVMGNHELAIADRKYQKWFNANAKKALKKNTDLLSVASIEFIQSLQPSMIEHECHFVHGFPPDSSTTYLFHVQDKTIQAILKHIKTSLNFVGHTHALKYVTYDGDSLERGDLDEGTKTLDKDKNYIINVGSVGQPRDGNNNAKYVIFDTEIFSLDVRFIPYDFTETANKIKKLGIPNIYAERLL